jgi:hypothetical protein
MRCAVPVEQAATRRLCRDPRAGCAAHQRHSLTAHHAIGYRAGDGHSARPDRFLSYEEKPVILNVTLGGVRDLLSHPFHIDAKRRSTIGANF